ncbi:MAG: sigma-54-dependent Fis family transcriptional regulator [Phycisphaerae bacterium]|nr:sigma-54-dependent Fis family transcriptional regulator [Phycisphaerae bacterium]
MEFTTDKMSRASLRALTEASAAINASLDLPQVLDTISRLAAAVLRAEASSVLLLDKRRNKLVFAAAFGEQANSLLGQEFDANLGIAGQVAASGKAILMPNAAASDDHYKGIDQKSGFRTQELIAAPMVVDEQVVGVVEVLNSIEDRAFQPEDVDLLQVFGNLAAIGARNAQTHQKLKHENLGLRKTVAGDRTIIGSSVRLQEVLRLCDKVASSQATVLLLGETGTGKEMLARYVHNASPRKEAPFIAINCAALTETLLESELFGHEKGAFTGAVALKIGRFEMADGGTLFLDEIGDISQSTQVKLLRVLQEHEFVRVGGTRTVACDVRTIAATNRDLKAAISAGRFREDLYYRLNVFPIQLPPLRERREDIPTLAEHFTVRFSRRLGREVPRISNNAQAILTGHRWPGNIRELQNVIERALLLCDGDTIEPSHLPEDITGSQPGTSPGQGNGGLWDYERAMILKALEDANWNQSQAARALGISRDNLRYRVKKYKINRPGKQ